MLLALKSDYKALTGQDWKPGAAAPPTPTQTAPTPPAGDANTLLIKIAEQGDKVRDLKTQKADKSTIDKEVKLLLGLKSDYKNLTGQDWKPGMKPVTVAPAGDSKETLTTKITEQGNQVRDLKNKKAPKEQIDSAVKVLLDLKAAYKQLTGEDFPTPGRQSSGQPKPQKAAKQKPAQKEKSPVEGGEDGGPKKQTRLGLEAKKEEALSEWYSQVITKGEMIEYYDVSGCYIFRPWSYAIWEAIKDWFDAEIKKLGVQNCYFPIFVSKSVLEKEKTHIADFAPEVSLTCIVSVLNISIIVFKFTNISRIITEMLEA